MKKRIFKILICYIILILCVVLFIKLFKSNDKKDDSKIQVIATLFPDYDFVKQIGGDKVEVKMLLNSGVDSHNYEPSVKDMKTISDSDIFIYTGTISEPWAETIINSLEGNCKIIDASENIDLIGTHEFAENYNDLESTENEHLEENEYDSHIWLDPQNAIKMVDTICDSLCEYDPDNSEYYKENAENYKLEISELDSDFEEKLNGETLVFGGEFAYTYFISRYNLKYVSVYSSCGEDAEPSVQDVRSVIDYINKNNVTKVFYEELSEGTVAKMISEETNAKAVIFYTLHNVSLEEIETGASYVSIMRKNLENICN